MTDISKDGVLAGCNVDLYRTLSQACGLQIVASGGVSSPYDIENLKALNRQNLHAAIVGKALYDGRTTLRQMNIAAL